MPTEQLVPIPGSERTPCPSTGEINPDEPIDVTVVLRRASPDAAAVRHAAGEIPGRRPHLDRAGLAAIRPVSPAAFQAVESYAHRTGLTVLERDVPGGILRLSGSAAALCRAFHTGLRRNGAFRVRSGPLFLPRELLPFVVAVTGLDNRPHRGALRPYDTSRSDSSNTGGDPQTAVSPIDVTSYYDFPEKWTGRGQCIALIEVAGGYRPEDVAATFAEFHLPPPDLSMVSVRGGSNRPTGPSGGGSEVMLDIALAGAAAPGARLVVYFAHNTSAGFRDAIEAAIHDETHRPNVISVSWGVAETSWTGQSVQAVEDLLQDAAALGITVCTSSGDVGAWSGGGMVDGNPQVNYPASSPLTLTCGGTRLLGPAGRFSGEEPWNDGAQGVFSAYGVSAIFPRPDYQAAIPGTPPGGRALPDLVGSAAPGYRVIIAGKPLVVEGTSAVAPLFAGLIARINESLAHPAGHLNHWLYDSPGAAGFLRPVTPSTAPQHSWDPRVGLGRPDGARLLLALSGNHSG